MMNVVKLMVCVALGVITLIGSIVYFVKDSRDHSTDLFDCVVQEATGRKCSGGVFQATAVAFLLMSIIFIAASIVIAIQIF